MSHRWLKARLVRNDAADEAKVAAALARTPNSEGWQLRLATGLSHTRLHAALNRMAADGTVRVAWLMDGVPTRLWSLAERQEARR
jgi:hypothetical protein